MAILKNIKNFLAPMPVVLVTVRSRKKDKVLDNIIPISWTGIVEHAPHMLNVNISRGKYSAKIIIKSRQFGVCIPGAQYLKQIDICGTTHGDKTDKFKLTGFEKYEAEEIDVPLLKQCPINMECVLKKIVSFKTHDMFVGRIVATHLDEEYMDENGQPDYKKMNILCYVNGYYWTMGELKERLYFTKTRI
jgi:flavin reductase (DIM6/NTAB) family NADH-FMN oxidoreductase RutF